MPILSVPAIFLLLVTVYADFDGDVKDLREKTDFISKVRTLWVDDDTTSNTPGAVYERPPPDVGETIRALDHLSDFRGASLKGYFDLLTAYNGGSSERYRVVLWTGPMGKAQAEANAAKEMDTFGGMLGPMGLSFTDTKIPVLNVTFDELINGKSGPLAISREWKTFWMTANCMVCLLLIYVGTTLIEKSEFVPSHHMFTQWLLKNSQVAFNLIDVWSSINAYEMDDQKRVSPGARQLMVNTAAHPMVTKAFVIGSYFWDTEMLVLSTRPQDVRTVNIHLMTYINTPTKVIDVNNEEHTLPTPNGWADSINLFGEKVPDFPIVFRDSSAPVPHCFANFEVPGLTTLYGLIAAYNTWQTNNDLRINVRATLRGELNKLQALVAYSKAVAQKGRIINPGESIASAPGYGDWFDIEQFGAMNEATNDVVVVTGKDLAILALFLLNVCMVTILITKCNKSTKSREKKVMYGPVSVMSESELVSVQ